MICDPRQVWVLHRRPEQAFQVRNAIRSTSSWFGGQESTRSLVHLPELLRLADAAGLLRDPELAAARMRKVMTVHGVEG